METDEIVKYLRYLKMTDSKHNPHQSSYHQIFNAQIQNLNQIKAQAGNSVEKVV